VNAKEFPLRREFRGEEKERFLPPPFLKKRNSTTQTIALIGNLRYTPQEHCMKKPLSFITKKVLIGVIAFFVIAGLLSTYTLEAGKTTEIDISTLIQQINKREIKTINIEGSDLKITKTDGTKESALKESAQSFTELATGYGVNADQLKTIEIKVVPESSFSFWFLNIFPILFPILLFGVLIFFFMRQVQGSNNRAMSFGQSGAREQDPNDPKNKVTFADVAGAKEAKLELSEIVDFLKNPGKFAEIGAKIPKGALLMGSPGTGKTLLSRAVAGEAGVPFYHISGSEFVEMFVGVGASRVRDLFAKAKKSAPCIIFIDEIDAVGRQRGAGLGGSHDEREQTLNQILVEMDGFEPNAGVIVLAATNRPDVLDPALLRPGRFDRRIVLDEPDINDREAILKIHAQHKPLAPDVDIRKIAQRTPGFSGADLANVFNEAAILSARKDEKTIPMQNILDSIEKVLLGPERKSYMLSEHERKVTAYHEGGHALVAHILPNADPVHKVSIVSRGMAAGFTLKMPDDDRRMHRKAEFLDDLAVSLGGYVAETEIFGAENLTTGASSDLRKATQLARRLVTDYGMSDKLGPRTYGEKDEMIFLGKEMHHGRDYSEKIAEQIDHEISRMLDEALTKARDIMIKHRDKLDKIANALLEKETLEREAFETLLA
jgi:cell division protease FtsH